MRALMVCASALALAGCAKGYWEGFGERAARASAILNAGTPGFSQQPAPQMQPMQPGRFFVRSFVSGMNRICVYNSMGSEVYDTIPATSICPLN